MWNAVTIVGKRKTIARWEFAKLRCLLQQLSPGNSDHSSHPKLRRGASLCRGKETSEPTHLGSELFIPFFPGRLSFSYRLLSVSLIHKKGASAGMPAPLDPLVRSVSFLLCFRLSVEFKLVLTDASPIQNRWSY
jgi:hypothetical protein